MFQQYMFELHRMCWNSSKSSFFQPQYAPKKVMFVMTSTTLVFTCPTSEQEEVSQTSAWDFIFIVWLFDKQIVPPAISNVKGRVHCAHESGWSG